MKYYTVYAYGVYFDFYEGGENSLYNLKNLSDYKGFDLLEIKNNPRLASDADCLFRALAQMRPLSEERIFSLYDRNCIFGFNKTESIMFQYPYGMSHQEIDESFIEPKSFVIENIGESIGYPIDYNYVIDFFYDTVNAV